MSGQARYISIRDWRSFQHYDPAKRTPPWIKNYTELLHDDAYLNLSAGCRAVLHGLWLEYASSHCRVPVDTKSLTRRLSVKVLKSHLTSLNEAGFIDFVASAALADGYHDASAETETETETETEVEEKDFSKTFHSNGDGSRQDKGCDNCAQRPAFNSGSRLLCESCLQEAGLAELITSDTGDDVDIPF